MESVRYRPILKDKFCEYRVGSERQVLINSNGTDKARLFSILILMLLTGLSVAPAFSQKVPLKERNLPDPLVTISGKRIKSSKEWERKRRNELLELFRTNIYGRNGVERPKDLTFKIENRDPKAMNGRATLKEVKIGYSGPGGKGHINLVLFIPNKKKKKVPAFLLICNRPTDNIDPTRKNRSEFWPAERIVERGYAAAAFFVGDVDPDEDDGFKNGVHAIFDPPKRAADAWGTIAAWAWGASRVMDYLVKDPDIDPRKIALIGHSRGGKTALWAGAQDQRFALTISNNSGSTGAALARGKTGQTVIGINKSFPHWFCTNYKAFAHRENELPVDQHELIALMAPRLVYVASSTEDKVADPESEFLAAVAAAPVYELYGLKGLPITTMPKPGEAFHTGSIAYHLREGIHNLTLYDWERYLDYADKKIKKKLLLH
jgi:hypothetical protein